MDKNDTVIVVGATEVDGYGHLWVTPKGGGDKVKIAQKRAHLHPLFEQGRAVLLHWETYQNRPYVANAKPVEGELPPPREPIEPEFPAQDMVSLQRGGGEEAPEPKASPQAVGMCWKEIGELIREDQVGKIFGKENAIEVVKAYRGYLLSTLKIAYDGKKLPQWKPKE